MTDTIGTMPNAPGTPRRTIRVDDELWEAALLAAQSNGESLPGAIRKFLKRYVKSSAFAEGVAAADRPFRGAVSK